MTIQSLLLFYIIYCPGELQRDSSDKLLLICVLLETLLLIFAELCCAKCLRLTHFPFTKMF